MKQTIGIYTDNDWAGAEAFAEDLRKAENCAVRLRNGALFTLDQFENFDAVYVHGDFPAVMSAYPDAQHINEGAIEPACQIDPEADAEAAFTQDKLKAHARAKK